MKKICMILFIGVFLALMVSLPGVAEENQKVKFILSVGGLVTSISQGYDYSFIYDDYGEDFRWTEMVPNIGGKIGLDIGASIYPTSQLEIYVSYSIYRGTALGDYTAKLPHIWYYDETVSNSMGDVENGFKASVFSLGVAFHPIVAGKIKPYFGVGMSNANVKVDLVDSVSFDNLVSAEFYYDYDPPYYWEEVDHKLDITSVGFTEESESVWGFHAKVGIDVEVRKNISLFVEGSYLNATAKFARPDGTFKVKNVIDYYEYYYGSEYEYHDEWTDEEKVDVDDVVKIKVGGIQGIIGLRFSF